MNMRKWIARGLFAALLGWLVILPAYAQTGTAHGVNITANVPSPVGGSGVLDGYNAYRCSGTCTATSGTWTKINPSLLTAPAYLDPASDSGLTAGATFSFAMTSVDSNGNESVLSNVATVAIPSAGFPTNPNAPSGCAAKTQ